MSEHSPMRTAGGDSTQHSSGGGGGHNDDTFDDAASAANNSIIGKVKSRVSSILPNRLSKWFSPSTKTNDSHNGSLLLSTTMTANARRRRRIELDDEEDDDEEEDVEGAEEVDAAEYDENSMRRHNPAAAQDDNSDEDDAAEEDEEESNNSEEDTSAATTMHPSGGLPPRRALSVAVRVRQPPSKRSRFNLDITSMRDGTQVPRQPLVASTPAMGGSSNVRGVTGSIMSNPPSVLVPTRGSAQRYSHLNLYGGQKQDKREPAYNFFDTSKRDAQSQPHYESQSAGTYLDFTAPQQLGDSNAAQGGSVFPSSGMSSRRSLNIPSTLQNSNELMYTGGLSHLKRQSLATMRNSNLPSTSAGMSPLQRTSTAILEVEGDEDEDEDVNQTVAQVHTDGGTAASKHNGRSTVANAKRQKLINGAGGGGERNVPPEDVGGDDSVSESSAEGGCRNEPNNNLSGRKTGLFNMSAANSRNGSRTSSFGNGLNFYSHLEGRKSLFAGGQGAAGAVGNASSVAALNNSTMSLTSLNRRQFNASIYGSTSALSDSRLLNTFSPFYKGKTTYGGAAAYNKYAAAATGTGAGASAVRLTPTLIRPTSSLSTLSSSSNSLAAGGVAGVIAGGGENSSAISSTAKRILDLINDFATPLSEAKKMASNLKTQQHQQLQSKSSTRLNEADLQATRALRLSQVRTPYNRPSVTLQPTSPHLNGKSATLPPTRELQVPSMSQLLQMKKMQSTTERSRQITTQNTFATATKHTPHAVATSSSSNEYTLPKAAAQANRSGGDWQQSPPHQLPTSQKYTNKMKNKVSGSARITGSAKDAAALADANAPPPAVNLPNIAFPLMQSVPKIDIKLPSRQSASGVAAGRTEFKFGANSSAFSATSNTSAKVTNPSNTFEAGYGTPPKFTASAATNKSAATINFKFSAPLELKGLLTNTPTQQITPICSSNYKFSPPTLLEQKVVVFASSSPTSPNTSLIKTSPPQKSAVPQLKTGSVLDALKKPLTAVKAAAATFTASSETSFGSQFKKSSSEWECDACMLRNKQDAVKCVACETPRKSAVAAATNVGSSNLPTSFGANSFGSQFKKSSSEWECDACLLRNKQDAVKCVACETPHKGATAAATTAVPILVIKNSFGDSFKPKSNTWECDTCLVNNKADCNECVACQTRRPGAPAVAATSAATSNFKFGFSNSAAGSIKTADAGFKTLAAEQKATKWECEACMTRNDAARVKCVCCEQAKPGTQTVSESVPKFSFGASAAAKYSFGFGAANDSKETELRQKATPTTATATSQKTDAPAPTGFTFGVKAAATDAAVKPASGGFTFGIKPDANKDATLDNNSAKPKEPASLAGFKFGATAAAATSTAPASAAGTGLLVGASKSAAVSSASNSISSGTTTSSSVKFSLSTAIKPPTTTSTVASSDTSKASTAATPAATFSFGSPAAAVKPASGGFSFGSASPRQSSKKDDVAAAPALGGFAFKTPAVTAAVVAGSTTTAAVASSTSTIAFGTTAAAAASKPMFSFGSPASNTTAPAATTTSSTAAPTAGGFSFGSTSSGVTTSATPAAATVKSLFGAAAATTALPATSANVFGSSTSSSALPVYGATSKVSAAVAPTATAASSTSTFGSFGNAAASNTNVFGSFGGQSEPATKPTGTATPFGSNISSTAANTAAASTPFLFGSSSSAAAASNANSDASAASSTWPKNSFVFGSATAATSGSSTADAGTAAKTSNVFGSFGATQSATGAAAPSLFGASTAPATAPQSSVFGSAASSMGTSAIFGSNSASSVATTNNAPSATNLFSSAGPSGNATTPAPAFGTSPFGGGGSSASATPTFGSAAAAPTTFGGFGSAASVAAASSVTDGASAAKKSDPSVFSFGGGGAPAPAAAVQATSGGFNFGAPAPKPAFNFAPTNQPAFNFTGTTEQTQTMTMTTTTTAIPFQFGATPAAPVFNFSGGAVETTPNAPFQFNAGATPASSNIFAPQPTPGAPQSAQQQARRKIRAPIRRQTPR